MKQEVLQNFPHIELTAIALLIFFTIFCGMLYWINRKDQRSVIQHLEQLPLDKESLS